MKLFQKNDREFTTINKTLLYLSIIPSDISYRSIQNNENYTVHDLCTFK